jgi:ferredoxin
MKIRVDYDLCEGNSACMRTAPHIFHVDDTDRVRLLIEAPGESDMEKVQAAVRRCPRGALSLVEDAG